MRDYELEPDLVLKIKVPPASMEYISRSQYLTISHFLISPSDKIERAYSKAEKQISKEMEEQKENLDPQNMRIRLQRALNLIGSGDEVKKSLEYINPEHEV